MNGFECFVVGCCFHDDLSISKPQILIHHNQMHSVFDRLPIDHRIDSTNAGIQTAILAFSRYLTGISLFKPFAVERCCYGGNTLLSDISYTFFTISSVYSNALSIMAMASSIWGRVMMRGGAMKIKSHLAKRVSPIAIRRLLSSRDTLRLVST